MKKMLRKSVLLLTGMALTVGSAQAANVAVYRTGDVNDGQQPLLVANEIVAQAVADADVADLGPVVVGGVGTMIVSTAYVSPLSLSVTLDNNGRFLTAGQPYLLFAWDDLSHDGVVTPDELNVIHGASHTPVTGVVSGDTISWNGPFEPVGGGQLPAGSRLVILADDPTAVTGTPTAAAAPVQWDIIDGIELGSTIQVTAVDTNSAGDSSSNTATFAQAMDEFVLCSAPMPWGPFNAVIDLDADPPRTEFSQSTGGWDNDYAIFALLDRNGTDTSPTNSPECGDTVNYQGQFSAIVLPGQGSVASIDGLLTTTASDQAIDEMWLWTETSSDAIPYSTTLGGYPTGSHQVVEMAPKGTYFDWEATINGEPIDARTFDFSITSTPNANYPEMVYQFATGVSGGAWTYGEGYDVVVPYVGFGIDGYLTFFRVANNNNMENSMYVRATCKDTVSNIDMPPVGAPLNNVPANSNQSISAADVAGAIGLDPAGQYICTVEFISDAPASLMQMEAINKGPTGRSSLHVYNKTQSALYE